MGIVSYITQSCYGICTMTADEFMLYERRIDNCFTAAERATDPHFRMFWYQTAMTLLRKMNRAMR